MKIWVKFLEDRTLKQKNAEGKEEEVKFTKGDIVQFEKAVAEQFVSLGLCEETDEPKAADLESITKSMRETIEKTVEESISGALENVTKKLEEAEGKAPPVGNFAKAKSVQAEFEAETGFKSEDHFFKCVRFASDPNNSHQNEPGMEFLTKAPSGQNISSDVEGNFLVPEPMLNTIWTNVLAEPTSLLARSNQFTTANTSLKLPRMFEPSRKEGDGLRNAGIQAYWEDEADQHTPSKWTSGRIEFELNKVSALTYATEELLDDTGFNLSGKFGQLATGAINFKVNDAIVHGSGVGKPKGILVGDSIVVVPLEAGQADFTILHRNISNLYHRNRNRMSAVFLAHPDLVQQLEFLYFNDDTTNQRPVYLPANQISGTPFGTIYGRPVIPFEFMNGFGDLGDIAFVDMSQYGTLTKAGQQIKSASSIHVRFLFDEIAFKWTFRVDGRELWSSAVEDLKGDTVRSWATVLAARNSGGTSSGI
jgi:HK97 family phage major capsid protein